MFAHFNNLGQDRLLGPLDAKHIRQFLQVVHGGLPNAEDAVTEPSHTQAAELFIEELHAELGREQGNVLDDGLSDSPLLVFRKLHDRRQESG